MLQATRLTKLLSLLRTHRTRLILLAFGVFAPLCLFFWLADEIVQQEPFLLDRHLLLFMHSHAAPWLDRIMLLLSRTVSAGWAAPFDILLALFLLARRRVVAALFWGLAVGGAAALNFGAKLAFGRVRPDLWISIAPETTYSFPSGHAMQSMAIVAALIVLCWSTRWRWFALAAGSVFVAAVGLSRVYLGVHYPTDILAGWAMALAWTIGLRVVLHDAWPAPRRTGAPM
jgi:undecaprenyl-diphosphatase